MDWSLDSYFSAFDGPDYRQFKSDLNAAFAALRARIEAEEGFEPAGFAGWQAIVLGYEELDRKLTHLSSYLECLTASDAANEAYQREQAAVALFQSELAKLQVQLVGTIGGARHDHFEAFVKRDALADAAFAHRRWREQARHIMSPDEEALAAELEVDGLKAWSRLYDTLSGTLEFTLDHPDGRSEVVPMALRRSMMAHRDRRTRAAAFAGGNRAWQGVERICAAALNGIAGGRLTLVQRRSYRHFLEPAVFAHRMGRASLDALQQALLSRAEVTRRLLRLKARQLGQDAIAWYDLEAPTPGIADADGGTKLEWAECSGRVLAAFERSYPALGNFFRSMLEQRWIDYTPRRGRRPGAFCTTSLLTRESRIFMSLGDSANDIVTLAHEAGHAWHAHVMREQRPLARDYPMTLAESASTFGEMLFIDAMLDEPGVADVVKRKVLDSQLRQAAGFLLDVPMRFEFERRFYEERADGEVAVSRLKALMVEAQRKLFGDALAPGEEDPWFWASKLHFYIADVPFYNFPYTVGFLLSRTLFARFKHEGAAFLPTYEKFLARSGSATCETLAKEVLGADLEAPEFWESAIDSIADIQPRLEAALGTA